MRRAALAAGLVAAALAPPPAVAAPIPNDPAAAPLPEFEGAPATPRRIAAKEPPRHPFMAPNARSNLHNDAFQTDTNWSAGPLGRGTQVTSTFQVADCASVTFDSRGRIVTVCVGLQGPRLMMFDPRTLEEIARMTLPPRIPTGGGVFNDFAGGGYFYLDERDRAVIPTTTGRILVVAVRDDGFVTERDYDLSSAVTPARDKIISALPDWSGRLWFATTTGKVGTVDRASGAVRSRALGEEITNSFAVDDSGGVYVVTGKALYRLDAASSGAPAVTWRQPYPNSGIAKPGQSHAGSGTTPTVMENGRVAITDNADPMHVAVYRRARAVSGNRLVCRAPVFAKGASATDQSLIAAGNSIVTENNYGYSGPTATESGKTTSPGLERVDVTGDGRCKRVWRSGDIAPSVVPKLSVETGLVYTYTKPPRPDGTDAWYFTALDFCTGRRVYRRLMGTGLGYNNNFAPVTLGPDGTAYVGTLGGLTALRDARPPSGPPARARKGCASARRAKPRLKLRLRYKRGRRGCARTAVRASVIGRDRRKVRRAGFYLGRRRVAVDRRAPFRKRLDHRSQHRGKAHRHRVKARVRLKDGRRATLRKRVRFCAQR